jgi:hypothetical protein
MPAASPTCPSCAADLAPRAAVCAACGYSAAICLRRIPYRAPDWERFIDPGARLDAGARRKVMRSVRAVERIFPQIEIVTALADLPAGMETREFGFWLFNAATPRTAEEHVRRAHAVLFVIDVTRRRAALVVGYALERWLSATAQEEILVAGVAAWASRAWARGLATAVEALGEELILAHQYATHHPGPVERRVLRHLTPDHELA